MSFIKPSTSTNLTTPYDFKGGMPSTAQNYIDLEFPFCFDIRGGNTVSGTTNFNAATINLDGGSTLTINATDFFNMYGSGTFSNSAIVVENASIINLNDTTGVQFNGSSAMAFTTGTTLYMRDNSQLTFSGTSVLGFLGSSGAAFGTGTTLTMQSGSFAVIDSGSYLEVASGGNLKLADGSVNYLGLGSSGATLDINYNSTVDFFSTSALQLSQGSSFNQYTTPTLGFGTPVNLYTISSPYTLPSSIYQLPLIRLTATSNLTGNVTIKFPDSSTVPDGTVWLVDLFNASSYFNGQSIFFESPIGSNTQVINSGASIKGGGMLLFTVTVNGNYITVG